MSAHFQSAELLQDYEDFRKEMEEKLKESLKTLRTTIISKITSHATVERCQTRHGEPPRTGGSTAVSLDSVLSKSLDEFATKFVKSLDEKFNRRFSLLSGSVGSGQSSNPGQSKDRNTRTEEGSEPDSITVPGEPASPPLQKAPAASQGKLTNGRRRDDPAVARDSPPRATNADFTAQPGDESSKATMTGCPWTSTGLDDNTTTSPLSEIDVGSSLAAGRMGENLVPSIINLLADDKFTGKVTTENIEVNWAGLGEAIKPPEDYDLLGVEYAPGQTGQGFTLLRLSTSTRFKFPDFSRPVDEPSQAEIQNYLQQLTTAPPKKPIPYYVGPPLTSDFDCLLHSGAELAQFKTISGVNTPYWHAGEKGSGTAFHCEDARFRSCNITLFGYKLWVVIQENDTAKFEAFIKKYWGGNGCDQFVRHNSLLISPARLKAEGIKFDIHCTGPGDMIVTAPRQYHAVVNLTNCFAVSINFLLPHEPVIPVNLIVCPKCGLYALDDHHRFERVSCPASDSEADLDTNERVRKSRSKPGGGNSTIAAPQPRAQMGRRKPLPSEAATTTTTTTLRRRKRTNAHEAAAGSKRQKKDISLVDLAARLVDANSVRRFMTHVATWRNDGSPMKNEEFNIKGSWDERAAQYYMLGNALGNTSKLRKLLSLIARIRVAQGLDDAAKDLGYERAPPDMIEKVLWKLDLAATASNRSKFQTWLRLPRKLIKVLGPYRGLLSFVALDEEGPSTLEEYLHLSDDDISQLQTLLESKRDIGLLAKTGLLFEESVLTCTKFPNMIWESIDAEELDKMNTEGLSRLLGVRHIEENVSESPDWQKPEGWPGDWPMNPDSLPTGNQCDLCRSAACECVRSCFAPDPRVTNYGLKGLGLQAVTTARGELVYKMGERIGQIVGRIVAPGTHQDGFALDFVRSDMAGEPIVGQIYAAKESNIFRFVNHRCRHPSATVRGVAISQRYRVIFYASRDIYHGDEITVNWGHGFLGRTQCLCEDCDEDGLA